MEQLRMCCGCCAAVVGLSRGSIVWVCLLALLLNGTLISALLWEPDFVDIDPISPVIYDFIEGNNRICISLSPIVTVVVTATIVDPSLSYWVDKPPYVNITLLQTRRECYDDAGEMCLLLILTTTNPNLTEGVFNILYNNVTTELAHGPIGFSDPTTSGSGSNFLLFRNNTAVLMYRQTGRESSANLANIRTNVAFRVCSNGEFAHFQVSAFPLTDCRLGRNAGGYSVPYAINLVYAGFHNVSGQQFTIVSSENCTSFSTSYHFIALDAALIVMTTMATPPITSPSPMPSASTDSSPAATYSSNISSTVIAIAVLGAAVVLALVMGAVAVKQACNRKDVPPLHQRVNTLRQNQDTLHQNQDTLRHNQDTLYQNQDTLRHNQDTLHQNQDILHHNQDTLHQNQDTLRHNQDTLRHNQDTLHQNQELILNNQDTILSNQDQQALAEQDISPELTESG